MISALRVRPQISRGRRRCDHALLIIDVVTTFDLPDFDDDEMNMQ